MTLIAITLNHKVPFVMGDLLISSKAVKKIQLPTNNFDVNEYLPPHTYKPYSLNQKIYIIKKNVCVALAGDVAQMTAFLKELKTRCGYYDDVKEEHLQKFLTDYNLVAQFNESAFFIMLVEHSNEHAVNFKWFNYPKKIHSHADNKDLGGWGFVKSDIYSDVYACGSGKKSYLSILTQEAKFTSSFEKGEIWQAIQSNLILIAKLLAIEKVTLHTLRDHWGGGFETLFYDGETFIKIENIAYVISQGEFDETGDIRLPIPRLILYYNYYEGVLFITAIEIKKCQRVDSENNITITSFAGDYDFNLFVVPGIEQGEHQIISDETSQYNFSFRTSNIAMGYSIVLKNNNTLNPAFFTRSADLCVTYEREQSIQITMRAEINDEVRNAAKKVFPSLQ